MNLFIESLEPNISKFLTWKIKYAIILKSCSISSQSPGNLLSTLKPGKKKKKKNNNNNTNGHNDNNVYNVLGRNHMAKDVK
jgi:hypothetical protein